MSNQLRLLLLIVVISGALCTVEDYVIMSQCAHNRAIHVAAEGTVSVTDITQTQNITIVGLPNYTTNDFKIALYAKDTQRYLCFNEQWKLVGMRDLKDTCYFNETIVHGYFVFRSVVDLQRRVGFTHRGKAVGPKKSVNDACYLFTKIPSKQFFHQHIKHIASKAKFTTSSSPSTVLPVKSTAATVTQKQEQQQQQQQRTRQRNRNNQRIRNNNNNNNNQNQQMQHSNGHNSSSSLSSNNSSNTSNTSNSNSNLSTSSSTDNQQQHQHQQQSQHHHQVRHHHNDPSLIARRQQHEHKQKRQRQRQRQRQRATTTSTKTPITRKTQASPTPSTAIISDGHILPTTSTAIDTPTPSSSKVRQQQEQRLSREELIRPTQVAAGSPSPTSSSSSPSPSLAPGTKALLATTTVANKRKGRRRKGERVHRKHSPHKPKLQHEAAVGETKDLESPLNAKDPQHRLVITATAIAIETSVTATPRDNETVTVGGTSKVSTTPAPTSATTTIIYDDDAANNVTGSTSFEANSPTDDEWSSVESWSPYTTSLLAEPTPTLDDLIELFSSSSTVSENGENGSVEATATDQESSENYKHSTASSWSSAVITPITSTTTTITTTTSNSINTDHQQQLSMLASPTQVASSDVTYTLPDLWSPATFYDKLDTTKSQNDPLLLAPTPYLDENHVDDESSFRTNVIGESTGGDGEAKATTTSMYTEFDDIDGNSTSGDAVGPWTVTIASSSSTVSDDSPENYYTPTIVHRPTTSQGDAITMTATTTTTTTTAAMAMASLPNNTRLNSSGNRNSPTTTLATDRYRFNPRGNAHHPQQHKNSRHRNVSNANGNPQQMLTKHRDDVDASMQEKLNAKVSNSKSTTTTTVTTTWTHPSTFIRPVITVTSPTMTEKSPTTVHRLLSVDKNIISNGSLLDSNSIAATPTAGTSSIRVTASSSASPTTRKSLRKSTQKLLATAFHQLTYVRNNAGEIDIDNIDDISSYPGEYSEESGNDGAGASFGSASAADDNTDYHNHHNLSGIGIGSSSSVNYGNSRLTVIGGYLPTLATSTLPESIRIAKVKIDKERKRLLRQQRRHFVRNYAAA